MAHDRASAVSTPRVPPIPILLLIDCEPDARALAPGHRQPWRGFERLFDFLAAERARLADRTAAPVRFNWFWRMDPQIEAVYGAADWAVQAYAGRAAAMARAGDAIGLHTHAFRWDEAADAWINDHGSPAWVEHCLRRSFSAFRVHFGRDCALFRFGDGWFDPAIIPLLEELGVRIDLTIEPGVAPRAGLLAHERSTGRLPDRRGAPRRPYHPSLSDLRRADCSGGVRLWELPASTGALIKRPKLRRPLRLLRWWRSPKRHMLQFNLETLPKRFPQVFDRVLAAADPAYAAICLRTDAGTTAERLDAVRRNLDAILRHPLAGRFRFLTPEEALPVLTTARPHP